MGPTVVLFTRDLRVHDQPALRVAADGGGEVVPLFVVDDALAHHRCAANRFAFLRESLLDLRTSLRERGGDLVVRRGDAVVEATRLARELRADRIVVGDDASAHAQRRRRRLERECARERIELRIEETVTVVPIGALEPADRDHYRVFTPYWRRWREVPLPPAAGAPERIALPPGVDTGRLPQLDELTTARPSSSLPRGGESAARLRLERWLADGVERYDDKRNDLAAEGTSRLSPYLHFGCISPRSVAEATRARGAAAEGFLRQLCWRDFYAQLLAANPRTTSRDLDEREREWTDDEDALARWAGGETGIPIVDAGMRQLVAEGWMHNRARLLVGSFLTKTLGIDWRLGAEVFFQHLVDGDVASNVGNWQWVAGTGVDPRPHRRFNPVRQAKRFDPDGAYVRRYVPELAELDGAAVHEPWRGPLADHAPEYPAPMVDYAGADATRA